MKLEQETKQSKVTSMSLIFVVGVKKANQNRSNASYLFAREF